MLRLFDIILSSIAIIIFSPFGLIISVLLLCTGEHEVFYKQTRLGRYGKQFGMLKFATMLKDSPNCGTGDVTVKNDPRVLPVGKFLRKTKLNEVPQIINIWLGDMSVVGPRPQTPKNFELFYGGLSEKTQNTMLSMRPGLTGIGSIVFRDEESILEKMNMPLEQCYREVIGPYKAHLEEWYSGRQNVLNYFLLIFVTAWVVLFPGSEVYRRLWKSLPVE
jgi:lipopolysaccharide/colanic/teichoic acid biosynthesis glycosyltransferase